MLFVDSLFVWAAAGFHRRCVGEEQDYLSTAFPAPAQQNFSVWALYSRLLGSPKFVLKQVLIEIETTKIYI